MTETEQKQEAVQEFWNAKPCDSDVSDHRRRVRSPTLMKSRRIVICIRFISITLWIGIPGVGKKFSRWVPG